MGVPVVKDNSGGYWYGFPAKHYKSRASVLKAGADPEHVSAADRARKGKAKSTKRAKGKSGSWR